MYLLFMTCTPVFAGPKEDALGAYHWFFELFTTDNHDQIATLFAPDALFYRHSDSASFWLRHSYCSGGGSFDTVALPH